jgi:hypothetical protein
LILANLWILGYDQRLFSIALSDCIGKGNISRLQVQLGFCWRPKYARALIIEFSLPSSHHNRRPAIRGKHGCDRVFLAVADLYAL